jgi:hypothetical protein
MQVLAVWHRVTVCFSSAAVGYTELGILPCIRAIHLALSQPRLLGLQTASCCAGQGGWEMTTRSGALHGRSEWLHLQRKELGTTLQVFMGCPSTSS